MRKPVAQNHFNISHPAQNPFLKLPAACVGILHSHAHPQIVQSLATHIFHSLAHPQIVQFLVTHILLSHTQPQIVQTLATYILHSHSLGFLVLFSMIWIYFIGSLASIGCITWPLVLSLHIWLHQFQPIAKPPNCTPVQSVLSILCSKNKRLACWTPAHTDAGSSFCLLRCTLLIKLYII